VLIADAPPHGLEPSGDGFPNGDPEGRDPLEIARRMAASAITVYAVGCEPALGGYRFARDFMCSLAEITGGQAVALSSADKLADVIINGSAEEISLTRLTREVEDEVQRVRATAAPDEDEEMIQMRACTNLQSRGVKSKQMQHDGAMKQKNSSVWKGASSLRAAKIKLCKTEAAEEDIRGMDSFACESYGEAKESMPYEELASFTKSSAGPAGLRSMIPSFMKKKKSAPAPRASEVTPRAASRSGGGPVRRSMPVIAAAIAAPMSMEASEPAKSVKSNVLVEEDISYDQVKRIMARKSAK
jgi:hypothetical protein